MIIDSFDGDYRWLSNFYPGKVRYEDLWFPSVEHAYQAAKTEDRSERVSVGECGAAWVAKKMGRTLTIRPNWEQIKFSVMLDLIRQKFGRDDELAQWLLETGDAELIEGNGWNDTYWGVCRGKGYNHLGQILMLVRSEIREAQ